MRAEAEATEAEHQAKTEELNKCQQERDDAHAAHKSLAQLVSAWFPLRAKKAKIGTEQDSQ